MRRLLQPLTAGALAVALAGAGCQLIGGFEDHELGVGGGGPGGQGSTASMGTSGGTGGESIGGSGAMGAGSTSATVGGGPGICGDGTRNTGEECDDGDNDNNDGCTKDCEIDCQVFQGFLLNPATGHCYLIYPQLEEHEFAKALCSSELFKGTLVTVTSDEERVFLANALGDQAIGRLWLGAERVGPGDDGFEWATGEPWGYTKWDLGEPDNDPLVDANNQVLGWGARPAGEKNAVVCERSPGIPFQ